MSVDASIKMFNRLNLTNTQQQISLKFTTYVTVNYDWIISIRESIGSIGENSEAIPRYRAAYKAEKEIFDGFLPLYHEEPSKNDKMGVWIPDWTKDSPASANGILHYGHATLQQQPNFYNEPDSKHIWILPGVKDEWLENKKPIDLQALYDEWWDVTRSESLKFQQ